MNGYVPGAFGVAQAGRQRGGPSTLFTLLALGAQAFNAAPAQAAGAVTDCSTYGPGAGPLLYSTSHTMLHTIDERKTIMKFSVSASAILCALLLFIPSAVNATAPRQDTPAPAGDWDRIQQAGKLVIGTAADYPPFEFYNSDFELDGFDIALAKALGEELGVEVEFNDYAFDGLLDQCSWGTSMPGSPRFR